VEAEADAEGSLADRAEAAAEEALAVVDAELPEDVADAAAEEEAEE